MKYRVKSIRVFGVTLPKVKKIDVDKYVDRFFNMNSFDIDELIYFDAGRVERTMFQMLFGVTAEEANRVLDHLDYVDFIEDYMPCVEPFTSGELYNKLEERAEDLYSLMLKEQEALEEDAYWKRINDYTLF